MKTIIISKVGDKPKRKPVAVNVEPGIYDELADIREKTGLSVQKIVNILLSEALENVKIVDPEAEGEAAAS